MNRSILKVAKHTIEICRETLDEDIINKTTCTAYCKSEQAKLKEVLRRIRRKADYCVLNQIELPNTGEGTTQWFSVAVAIIPSPRTEEEIILDTLGIPEWDCFVVIVLMASSSHSSGKKGSYGRIISVRPTRLDRIEFAARGYKIIHDGGREK